MNLSNCSKHLNGFASHCKLGVTEADVRLKLAEEDDKAIADGDAALHAVTPAAMLIDLLEIEELQ